MAMEAVGMAGLLAVVIQQGLVGTMVVGLGVVVEGMGTMEGEDLAVAVAMVMATAEIIEAMEGAGGLVLGLAGMPDVRSEPTTSLSSITSPRLHKQGPLIPLSFLLPYTSQPDSCLRCTQANETRTPLPRKKRERRR